MTVTVTFVGTGDAFGTGGRNNTCILVDAPGIRFAFDFGGTSVVALNALSIPHNSIDLILVSHFHGDHFAGLPFMLLDAMLGARRERPLTIAGPPGLPARLRQFSETLFPGSSAMMPKFPLELLEIEPHSPRRILGLNVTTCPANHTPDSVPTSIRVEVAGKVIAFTGDTAWTEHLPALAEGSDLLIAECYALGKPVRFHLDYPMIRKHRDELATKRLILTHMGPEMLAASGDVEEECARDGLVIRI